MTSWFENGGFDSEFIGNTGGAGFSCCDNMKAPSVFLFELLPND
jgi:hypothetical protein